MATVAFGFAIRRFGTLTNRSRKSMVAYLQILGTGASEVGPSVFLFTEDNRYLFNCPESVQTLCYEHTVRFSRLRNLFITRMNWENVGGLPGMLMSLRESVGTDDCAYVYGPTALHGFQAGSFPFLNQQFTKMRVHTCPDIHSPVIYKGKDVTIEGYEVFTNDDEQQRGILPPLKNNECAEPVAKRPCLSQYHVGSVVFYIVRLCTVIGKFYPEKAQLLGLSPGPLYRQLAMGKSVIAPNGRTIFPHEVMDPEQPGPSFVVLECPSVKFIPRLVNHPQLQPESINPCCVIHIAPKNVVENRIYQEWLQTFHHCNAQNILLHQEMCKPEMVMRSCYRLQLPLNLIDSKFFHLPTLPCAKSSDIEPPLKSSCVAGRTLMKLHLKPIVKCGLIEDDSVLQPLSDVFDDVVKKLKTNDNFNSKIRAFPHLQEKVLTLTNSFDQKTGLPEESSITFLGTASAIPSKYRCMSAILVHLPSYQGYMFLDCGEGTLGQLYKCFGEEQADHILFNLRCIFVSHIHGDHHLGLIRILQRRSRLYEGCASYPRLIIIGPSQLRMWLEEYRRSCEHILFWFYNCNKFTENADLRPEIHDLNLKLKCLTTVPVVHIQNSFGIVLEHKEGWKLVYSGDTRPCGELVKAGDGADLLVHEATFDNTLHEDALKKGHSTLAEAVKVSQDMKAKLMICTHFSQRYPKFSTAMIANSSSSVAVAFDFMTVPIMNAERLRVLQPLIHDVFSSLSLP